jgi:hypothetical protein
LEPFERELADRLHFDFVFDLRVKALRDQDLAGGRFVCESRCEIRHRSNGCVICGLGDIYSTRRNRAGEWRQPRHFACAPTGPNSALDEQGPSYVEAGRSFLYFSRSSGSVSGDIYVSQKLADGSFGPATAVAELNSAGNDIQPNVRKDGLEVVLSSNRTGTLGGQDIWAATRASTGDPWSAPVNLGSSVNTDASESRPSLSWDALTLLFGRTPGPEGIGDVYVSTRTILGGP